MPSGSAAKPGGELKRFGVSGAPTRCSRRGGERPKTTSGAQAAAWRTGQASPWVEVKREKDLLTFVTPMDTTNGSGFGLSVEHTDSIINIICSLTSDNFKVPSGARDDSELRSDQTPPGTQGIQSP
ncbi:Protein of unknown function [Gryllus bimaculatus]|nr:Protein of unknown function [Gryllus bimaculatus]